MLESKTEDLSLQRKKIINLFILIYAVFALASMEIVLVGIVGLDCLVRAFNLSKYSLFNYLAQGVEKVRFEIPSFSIKRNNQRILFFEIAFCLIAFCSLLLKLKSIAFIALSCLILLVVFKIFFFQFNKEE